MNAREEFEEHTGANRGDGVKCAEVNGRLLPVGYNDAIYLEFLQKLDIKYDNGYGGQELYGTIWYKDGTWSDREEYDGSEWWRYNSCPPVPKELL